MSERCERTSEWMSEWPCTLRVIFFYPMCAVSSTPRARALVLFAPSLALFILFLALFALALALFTQFPTHACCLYSSEVCSKISRYQVGTVSAYTPVLQPAAVSFNTPRGIPYTGGISFILSFLFS